MLHRLSHLAWAAFALALCADAVWAARIDVALVVVGTDGAADLSRASVVARQVDGSGDLRKGCQVGSAILELPEGTSWNIGAEARGYWSATKLVVAGSESAITLRLFPTGLLTGDFGSAAGGAAEPPTELWVAFSPARGGEGTPGEPPSPEGRADCTVQGRKWACAVPAGRADFVLRPKGYVPTYLWGLQVPSGASLDVGHKPLLPGSSVSGWLETEDGGALDRRLEVKLLPDQTRSGFNGGLQALSAHPDARGFFQFVQVPAGAYRIQAEQQGYVPASLSGVVVLRDLEAQIRDVLVLRRPVDVELRIDPPLDPIGKPWTVRVWSVDEQFGNHTYDFEGLADWNGWWTIKGAPFGSYQLTLLGSGGNRFFSREIEVSPGLPVIDLHVPIVVIQGTVLLGEDPLAAKLRFGGRFGSEAVQLESDEEGHFSGVLGREGKWEVAVEADEPRVRAKLKGVEVHRGEAGGAAEVEVRLPRTEVKGTVVTESGDGVPQALVSVSGLSDWAVVQTRTDGEGTFGIVGFSEGPLRLEATAPGNRSSDPVTVDLSEDSSPVLTTLVVREKAPLVGRVVNPHGGPVPGADVLAYPGQDPLSGARHLRTDASGLFKAGVPPGTAVVRLVVDAPGFALRSLEVPLDGEEVREIGVDQSGGSLILELPDGYDLSAGPERIYIRHRGSVYLGSTLIHRARLWGEAGQQAGQLVIPALEAGPYEACLGTEQHWLELAMGAPAPAGCASGLLQPSGELRLRVRVSGTPDRE